MSVEGGDHTEATLAPQPSLQAGGHADPPLAGAPPRAMGRTSRRLDPRPWQANFLLLRALRAQLAGEVERMRLDRPLDVVDVGCGSRPYEPLFASRARSYVGVDIAPGPTVDVVAPATALPFPDDSFDCAVCSQVLEHVPQPELVVAELHRVLRPGGVALVSTHGVVRYHPNPEDYWRWTHAGLDRLFRASARWGPIRLYANGGAAAALTYLAMSEVSTLANRSRALRLVVAPLTVVLNSLASSADRMVRRLARDRPPALAPNYLVAAVAE